MKPVSTTFACLILGLQAVASSAGCDIRETSAADAVVTLGTIRRNTTGGPSQLRIHPTHRLVAHNVSLVALIAAAYEVSPQAVIGGPEWIRTERFNVDVASGTPSRAGLLATIRRLLDESLHLALSLENEGSVGLDLLVTSYSKLNTDICQMNDTISLYAILSGKTIKEFGVLILEQQ